MILNLTSYRKNKCVSFFQNNINTIVRVKLACEFERNLRNCLFAATFKKIDITDSLWNSLLLKDGILGCNKNYGKLYNKFLKYLNHDEFQKF